MNCEGGGVSCVGCGGRGGALRPSHLAVLEPSFTLPLVPPAPCPAGRALWSLLAVVALLLLLLPTQADLRRQHEVQLRRAVELVRGGGGGPTEP